MLRPAYALICLLALLIAFPTTADAAGVLVPRNGQAPIELQKQRVAVTIEDGLARTTVRQTFVNQHRGSLEAIYLFPMPEGAALVDVAMEVGGQRLEGLLVERKKARQTYNRIVRSQRDPALVEQIGRGKFRLSVFPVLPDKPTVVELTWIQHVPLTEGVFRYVYPLATDGTDATTKSDLAVSMKIHSSAPLADVTCSIPHSEVIRKGDHDAVMSYEESGSTLSQDITLVAAIERREPRLDVATFRGENGDGFFTAVITPPEATEDQILPRDVTLVIDTSGSMRGEKMEQARKAALYLLGNLRATDRVNVLAFSGEVRPFADQPVEATPENLEQLRVFVRALTAGGGTALGDALARAVATKKIPGRVSTIAFFTDGEPTLGEIQEPAEIVAVADRGGNNGLRIFTFGVGADVKAGLLRGMAAAGKGKAEIFRPAGEVATRLTRFLQRTSSPVMANVKVDADGIALHGIYPRPVPDLYLGEQIVLTGRYTGGGDASVSIRAMVGGKPVRMVQNVKFEGSTGGRRSVRDLYARQKLSYLEEARRIRNGLDDAAYYAALDKGAYSTDDEIVAAIIQLSLETGVQSAYTSFLVLLPEDRARLSPTDLTGLEEAQERSRQVRRETAKLSGAEEPVVKDSKVADHDETDNDVEIEETLGDPRFNSDAPFEGPGTNGTIGIGGGAGGAFGGRRGGHRNLRAGGGGRKTETAVDHGMNWLRRTQESDGSWAPAEDDGTIESRVSCTGTALLALLGFGETHQSGAYKDNVKLGLKYLKSLQREDGSFVVGTSPSALRANVIATCALSEAYGLTGSRLFKDSAQRGVNWMQGNLPTQRLWDRLAAGEEIDPMLTAWATLTFRSAKLAELEVDAGMFTPRPALVAEALRTRTADDPWLAVAILARTFHGPSPVGDEEFTAASMRLADGAIAWDQDADTFDVDHWHFTVLATFQAGKRAWFLLNQSLKTRGVGGQRTEVSHPARGSWDPSGVRADSGGRAYNTAMRTLSLEVYYRYGRVFGTR